MANKSLHSIKHSYPVYLNIQCKKCLVVGGGKVAERKIDKLFDAGAHIEVISPEITPRLKELSEKKKIVHKNKKYNSNDLKDAQLVFAATHDKKLNQKITADAKKKKMWVSNVSSGEDSTFILPALLKRDDFEIAISTRGKSPRLAKQIKERLEKIL